MPHPATLTEAGRGAGVGYPGDLAARRSMVVWAAVVDVAPLRGRSTALQRSGL
jgi:hypothetical protein